MKREVQTARKSLKPKTIQTFIIGKTATRTAVTVTKKNNMKIVEQYIEHIEGICGKNGRFFRISEEHEPLIAVISYDDVPENGSTTAFSYGLSSVSHSEWINSSPELVISVDSVDAAWPLALGELIRNGREKCTFGYGMVLNFGQPISDESPISSFLVYACTILNENDLSVKLRDRKVHLSQIYPVHQSEIPLIKSIGPDRFVFDLRINLFDVRRTPHV
jgi:hypothetical protein